MPLKVRFYLSTDKGYIPVYDTEQGAYDDPSEFATLASISTAFNAGTLPDGYVAYYNLTGGGKIEVKKQDSSKLSFQFFDENNVALAKDPFIAGYRSDRPDFFVLLVSNGTIMSYNGGGLLGVGSKPTRQPGLFPASYSAITSKHANLTLPLTVSQFPLTKIEKSIVDPKDLLDPYAPGGTSGAGGGNGTFDFSSTDIPIPGIPSISASDTGFISLYNPSAGQLKALANYLWSGSFTIENLRKLFADPMDTILGLHIIPMTADAPATTSAELVVGNISTEISMPRVTAQYFEVDCGTITISPKWGAYLDFSPYSKLSLYLPYIGFVSISPDDCMNGSIQVKYHVDVLSGACTAFVYCLSNSGQDGHTLYTYIGACACDCPINSGQYTNALFGITSIAASVASIGGAMHFGSPSGVFGGMQDAANAAISMVKPDVSRSGAIGGSAGLMGIQYPYLVLTIPKMCTPQSQNVYLGYPSFVTKKMSEITGYTQIDVTHLSGMSCTDAESAEIVSLLKEGVIF